MLDCYAALDWILERDWFRPKSGLLEEGYARPEQKARGVQENLWPKFILWNAPLRATSSGITGSILCANPNCLKTGTPAAGH